MGGTGGYNRSWVCNETISRTRNAGRRCHYMPGTRPARCQFRPSRGNRRVPTPCRGGVLGPDDGPRPSASGRGCQRRVTSTGRHRPMAETGAAEPCFRSLSVDRLPGSSDAQVLAGRSDVARSGGPRTGDFGDRRAAQGRAIRGGYRGRSLLRHRRRHAGPGAERPMFWPSIATTGCAGGSPGMPASTGSEIGSSPVRVGRRRFRSRRAPGFTSTPTGGVQDCEGPVECRIMPPAWTSCEISPGAFRPVPSS